MFNELKWEVIVRFVDIGVKHTPLRLTSAGFSMTISNTPIVLTHFSRFFHDYIKHTPLRRTSEGFSMTISNTPIASTDFSRFFNDLLKAVKTMGMFDIVMEQLAEVSRGDGCVWYSHETSIASADFSGFSHDYIKHTHRLDWLQQVFLWLYQTYPSLRRT
jgi:hypothetical protein